MNHAFFAVCYKLKHLKEDLFSLIYIDAALSSWRRAGDVPLPAMLKARSVVLTDSQKDLCF